MASYPSAVAIFPTHVNITDIIDASHPNNIQDEVIALETEIGLDPATSTTPSPSGTFTATSTAYADLTLRLANIETGIVSDAHSQYIRKAGDTGNIITPAASTTKGLVIKAASGQTANLQEWQNSSGTVVTRVDSTGALIGTASGNVALSTFTTAGDIVYATGAGAITRLGSGAQGTTLFSNGSSLYWGTPSQGTTGAQGIQGLQGPQGTTGIQGFYGVQGTQGLQGTIGSQGLTGIQGQFGIQGTQGILGLQGIAGAVAAQGLQGTDGAQGAQGALGIQGVQGITGFAAAQGYTGPQGTQGVQGTQGIQGRQGTTGSQGIQGIAGRAGGLPYNYVTAFGASDPGTGGYKVNSAIFSNTTEIYINETDADGNSRAATLSLWDGSTSAVKATITLVDADGGSPAEFQITGTIVDNGSWRTIPVTYISGSSVSAGTKRFIQYSITGDAGSQGVQGRQGTQGGGFNQSQGVQGPQGLAGTAQGTQGIQGPSGSTPAGAAFSEFLLIGA